ncbi:MAG: type III effector [Flavobacteriaceae bacterium]|nr:MAG: type III effector [Flavobacteriaceae bacterium]
MTLKEFKNKLEATPKEIAFIETMSVIESLYDFTPTTFNNGALVNEAEQNSGSCKLFAFAIRQGFTAPQTLACFGTYYFDEVLQDPNGTGHQNIRSFMKTGFKGLQFKGEVLLEK